MTAKIGQECGITHAAVSQWKVIPAKHVAAVARVTGIDVDDLPTSERKAA